MGFRLKIFIFIFISFIVFSFTGKGSVWAAVCTGSGSSTYPGYVCSWDYYNNTYYCNHNHDDTNSGDCSYHTLNNVTSCSFVETDEDHCAADSSGCTVSNQCGLGKPCYNPAGCTECTPDCSCKSSTCVGSTCSDGCGGTCSGTYVGTYGTWETDCGSDCVRDCIGATCNRGCQGTPATCVKVGTWSTLSCPDEGSCGQTLTATCEGAKCGGGCPGDKPTLYCPPTDDGIPDVPTCTDKVNIQGTLPVRVTWTTGGVLTDKYEYRFDVGATANTTNLYANWNADVGGTHSWQARAVNTSCGVDRSDFSNRCYFCYEKGNCLPACGQPSYCSGNCPTTDLGEPPAPTLVNPGTETNPISRLPGPITLKWAPASTDVLSDRWRILLTNIGNGKTISFPALDVGISKQLVDDALLATGRVYSWEVWGTNNDCPPTKWGAKAIGYFVLNSPPTVTGLRLSNCNGVNVPSETIGSTSRNQICQDAFRECTNPREVTFKAQVSDPEGWANISGATLYGMDKDYPMTKLTGSGLAGTMAVTVNFTDLNVKFDNQLGVGVSDIFGATGGDLFRYWKVWDCLVSVTGTIYENSPLSVGRCNPLHYTTPVTSSLGFKKLIFDDEVAANPDKQMDVVQPATYSGLNNINKLIWGSEYIPLFNDGSRGGNENGTLNGTTRKTRVIETTISGAGTTFCPPLNTFPVNLGTTTALSEYIVSPYKNNPQAMIDFSFFILPEGWFQVSGGGIKTKRDLRSGVPVGVVAPEIQALSIARVDADNGLITYGGAYTNNSGNTNLNFGDPNNWYEGVNANDSVKYGYQYFYDNFLVKAGIGIMATDWGSIASHTTDGGIFFVNGDLAINSDFTLAAGKTMIVIVKGDIAIGNNVKRIDGIYISEGGISASGTSVDQLVINGSLYSLSSVSFSRGYVNPSLNPTKPAVKINYQPSYMFNMPGILMRVLSGWREE